MWGVSLKHSVLTSFLCGEFLLHIPCWIYFYVGSFSYTSHACFFYFFYFNLGSFSYTSCVGFIFMSGVSLKNPVLTSFSCGEFLLHIPCNLCFYMGSFSYTSHAAFIFMQGVSLTHPVLSWFLCKELHIPCWHYFILFLSWEVCFSKIWCWFLFLSGVSLTHPVLASFLSGDFLLQIPC